MKKTTIFIVGGSQEQTYKKIGKKAGCDILFHNGKARNGGVKKAFEPMVKKADCVVVLAGACGHETMYSIKELCKANQIEVVFQKGFGASGAVNAALDRLKSVA
ncbi:DUF2325 domain-containing protein [Planococcus lenghuensis]|uniref:DUF2325 domain-containing protein n=1 Tax=Planococcus lenghuensis TaxID=2213202 RepID=A0A1Q2L4P8_9BACL|nr:DUF2325 domain-containing protein [Planococcus lenghuensis]AQQ55381.1 DUF2325 domain-containing protein [Planococcus lenghuensis]